MKNNATYLLLFFRSVILKVWSPSSKSPGLLIEMQIPVLYKPNPDLQTQKLCGRAQESDYQFLSLLSHSTRCEESCDPQAESMFGMALMTRKVPRCLQVTQKPNAWLLIWPLLFVNEIGFKTPKTNFLHTLWRFLMTFHKVSPT